MQYYNLGVPGSELKRKIDQIPELEDMISNGNTLISQFRNVSATAQPVAAGGTPSVAFTTSSNGCTFNFGIPAGATGETGPTGATGDTGPTGTSAKISGATASISMLAAGQSATVSVGTGGTATNRTFHFDFRIPEVISPWSMGVNIEPKVSSNTVKFKLFLNNNLIYQETTGTSHPFNNSYDGVNSAYISIVDPNQGELKINGITYPHSSLSTGQTINIDPLPSSLEIIYPYYN